MKREFNFLKNYLKKHTLEFNSKEVKKGSAFIALKGKRDGHKFIDNALKKGAKVFILEKRKKNLYGFSHLETFTKIIYTKDNFRFFKNFANYKKKLYKGKKIALTGSVGKTTTKEFLFYLLSKFEKTYKNIKSYNNFLGLLYTLSNLNLSSKYYVQELGTNHFGEIESLVKFLKPQIRIITKIGKAHLENFKNLEGVIQAKLEIIKDNNFDFAILPKFLKNYLKNNLIKKNNIYFFDEKESVLEDRYLNSSFERETTIKVFNKIIKVRHKILGDGFLTSLIIGAYLLYLLNLDLKILEDIRDFQLPSHRLNIFSLNIYNKNVLIIDDSYNANPTSFENLIGILKKLKNIYDAEVLCIFGKMAELGNDEKKEHEYIYNKLKSFSKVFLFNIDFLKDTFYSSHEALFLDILKFIKNSSKENLIIAFKGSRINQLEKIVEKIKNVG